MINGGTITIEATWRGSVLHVRIENPVDPDRPRNRKGGVGLDNVSKRLRAIYKDDAQVQTEEINGLFRVNLWLPAQTSRDFHSRNLTSAPSKVSENLSA
jgi:LytS/YehU family sensor histidine kinase